MAKSVGIVSIGTYLPPTVITSSEIAAKSGLSKEIVEEKLGFKQKPIPGENDHCSTMAIKAAKQALANAAMDPKEVDVLIWTGDEYKDYPLWTAGIHVAHKLGCTNASAFDISLRCGTTIQAIKLAKDMLIADPKVKTVLLAGGYRNGDLIDYQNPRVRFMYNLGAGASAVILQKDYPANTLLGSCFKIDGSLSETVLIPAGGTKEPLTSQTIGQNRHYLDVIDPDSMKERLGEVSLANFFGVIDQALQDSGLSRTDISYLALLHMKRSAHESILQALGLKPDQSIYLANYGHIGQHDQVLSLELALQEGRIKQGDIVVFVSAGIGYAWNALVIRWGKDDHK